MNTASARASGATPLFSFLLGRRCARVPPRTCLIRWDRLPCRSGLPSGPGLLSCVSLGLGPRVAAAHRDRPELLVAIFSIEPRGLDIERDAAKGRSIVAGPHPGVDELDEPLAALRVSVEAHRSGHEPLHQEPIDRPDVGFVEIEARPLAERFELALRPEVEGVDRGPGKRREGYLLPPDPGWRRLCARDEADRLLVAEHDPHRTRRAGCPQHELDPVRGIAPVARQQKDFRYRLHGSSVPWLRFDPVRGLPSAALRCGAQEEVSAAFAGKRRRSSDPAMAPGPTRPGAGASAGIAVRVPGENYNPESGI